MQRSSKMIRVWMPRTCTLRGSCVQLLSPLELGFPRKSIIKLIKIEIIRIIIIITIITIITIIIIYYILYLKSKYKLQNKTDPPVLQGLVKDSTNIK